jgi:zinc carboxypeptidase
MIRSIINSIIIVLAAGLVFPSFSSADKKPHIFKAMGAPAERKVDVSWNRFNDTKGIEDILRKLNRAYPKLTKLYSIGQSHEGREMWCLEVTNRKNGAPARKPGMYIDGNIHGNEVQASEVVAYTAWYLCESYDENEKVADLLDTFVFYLIPTINPDGRDHWFYEANTPHSSRTGRVPVDNDRDGLMDEDDTDDLDGNGSITMMRIKDANGRRKKHPDYPESLMVSVKNDERGEYTVLGWEGIDNDGDGRINEDGAGGYDPNRNWAYDWQPEYVQGGAIDYPFSLPNTRAVAEFVLAHPNIAAMQSYHNTGGMILHGPGREGGVMESADEYVLNAIAQRGEQMLPFYRNLVLWKDLYPALGGEFDWFYGARGILSYTNELWTPKNMFRNDQTNQEAQADFNKYLLLNEAAVEWKEYDHPTYGKIEIGGRRKEFGRLPPSFLLEEECHRNMAFTLYHASCMPRISFGELSVEKIGTDLFKVWVEVCNDSMMSTRSQHEAKQQITTPDIISLQGKNAKVISAGYIEDRHFKKVKPVHIRPQRVMVLSVPGMDSTRIQFIAQGRGKAKIIFDSIKGGLIEKEITLK